MICFHFSNFEPLETAPFSEVSKMNELWFAFILVTLSHWKQPSIACPTPWAVVICFHFSNFEPLETAIEQLILDFRMLWFAFILVTLSHWKQPYLCRYILNMVVICFHFSNFEPLETAQFPQAGFTDQLWFAFILVTLSHWKQHQVWEGAGACELWFAFILVTLSHWKQQPKFWIVLLLSCDLLSF